MLCGKYEGHSGYEGEGRALSGTVSERSRRERRVGVEGIDVGERVRERREEGLAKTSSL